MKKLLKKIHLYLALSSGIFLLLLSLSGAILVFGKEIQQVVSPDIWTVKSTEKTYSKHYQNNAIERVIESLQKLSSDQNTSLKSLNIQDNLNLAWVAKMSNGEQWNINPHTGEVIARFPLGDDFYSTILYFHRWLLFNETPSRDYARHFISIISTLFITQIIIGLWLWLSPAKRALRRLKFKGHKKRAANYTQWHLIIGVYSSVFLILIAYSGIGFNWPIISKAVEWVTHSTIEPRPQHKPVSVGGTAQWQQAINNAQQALPEAELQRIYFPQSHDKPLALRMKMPAEFHPFSYVWVDAGSAEVLGRYDASAASTATRVWNFKYRFHIGDFSGLPIRVLWLLLALLPSAFLFTGLWLWWNRSSR